MVLKVSSNQASFCEKENSSAFFFLSFLKKTDLVFISQVEIERFTADKTAGH